MNLDLPLLEFDFIMFGLTMEVLEFVVITGAIVFMAGVTTHLIDKLMQCLHRIETSS